MLATNSRGSNLQFNPSTRKDLRKSARKQKKNLRNCQPPPKRQKISHDPSVANQTCKAVESPFPIHAPTTSYSNLTEYSKLRSPKENFHHKIQISKASKFDSKKLTNDEREIAELERKLGLHKSKKSLQSFEEDGLDQFLKGLEDPQVLVPGVENLANTEGDEWLKQKRHAAQKSHQKHCSVSVGHKIHTSSTSSFQFEPSKRDSEASLKVDSCVSGPISDEELPYDENTFFDSESFGGFDSDDVPNKPETPRARENPFLPPIDPSHTDGNKTPPLSKITHSESEEIIGLRRRMQGLINRLTESNLLSILSDIEKLYREHPRQQVTTTLIDILLLSIFKSTSLPDTLIILPAGFIAAVYKIIGADFGAEIVQRITTMWDECYPRARTLSIDHSTTDLNKQPSNLVMLLAELYNFKVIGSNLIFDYIRSILGELSELNAELLLRIIRASGPQLRQDDPSSIKDIVATLRTARANIREENISVRTKFMMETIDDLKNNRLKTGFAASAITSEHLIRMKKTLGSLNNRNLKATEPLRIGLNDIRNSKKRGKWWLIGASWSGHSKEIEENLSSTSKNEMTRHQNPEFIDLIQLAREHRMNTDIRRVIFFTIMSAIDYQDACVRLKKLNLKKTQEYEISKVLVCCVTTEKYYNPYYTLIAKKLCENKKLSVSFQYCLWDLFKRFDETEEDEPGVEEIEELSIRKIVNLSKMFGNLIVEGSLDLCTLKVLNLNYLSPKTKSFVEVLFITIFLLTQKHGMKKRDEKSVIRIFSKVKCNPQLTVGLQYFLGEIVSKTDIAGGKQEHAIVKWACGVAIEALVSVNLD